MCTSGVNEIGWLTNSRGIVEECATVARTGKRWSEHSTSDSGAELVTAVPKCLELLLQDDGLLSIEASEPEMTGRDLPPWEETHVQKFCAHRWTQSK